MNKLTSYALLALLLLVCSRSFAVEELFILGDAVSAQASVAQPRNAALQALLSDPTTSQVNQVTLHLGC